ncbi:MAG: hypothetical protein IPN46_20100 [Saprospiraceae bacterium]|nr:hypothetical protein [Saprospiraceae bacterium]
MSTTPSTRCGIGTTTLSATSNNGIVHWFNSSTSTDILGTGNNFTTPEISQTTSFCRIPCFRSTNR